jgi:5'-3' exonuclease/ribosomal protein S27E
MTIALIDGDVIAYLSCKSRYKDAQGNTKVIDKYTHQFSDKENTIYLQESYLHFHEILKSIEDQTFASDMLIAMKSNQNYRDEIFNEYKLNRKTSYNSSLKEIVPTLREIIIFEKLAIEAVGREADDMLSIWAHQAMLAKEDYVIVSIDKDLQCIPGMYFNIKKNTFTQITPEFALKFFYRQLLSGDPTDNIPGLPGVGPVKAEKYLYNVNTEEEYQEIIVEQYINAFGVYWYDYLLSNGKMLYLQKSEHDYFKITHWPIVQTLLKDEKVSPTVLWSKGKFPIRTIACDICNKETIVITNNNTKTECSNCAPLTKVQLGVTKKLSQVVPSFGAGAARVVVPSLPQTVAPTVAASGNPANPPKFVFKRKSE